MGRIWASNTIFGLETPDLFISSRIGLVHSFPFPDVVDSMGTKLRDGLSPDSKRRSFRSLFLLLIILAGRAEPPELTEYWREQLCGSTWFKNHR